MGRGEHRLRRLEDSVNAVIEPSNAVTIGATTRSKKKGTAAVAVQVRIQVT